MACQAHSLTGLGFRQLYCWVFKYLVVLLLSISPLLSQEQMADEAHVRPRQRQRPEVRASETLSGATPIIKDVDVVLVPVFVTDEKTRMVTGLEKQNFELLENGQKQDIRYFYSEDAPVSVGFILDFSGSMSQVVASTPEVMSAFVQTSNPQDEFFVISFSSTPQVVQEFTQQVEHFQPELLFSKAQGRTALLDAIYLGLQRMKGAKYSKRALLVISDGGDNNSRYTIRELEKVLGEADVQIYGLGLFNSSGSDTDPQLLKSLSDRTGGRMFIGEWADAAAKISAALRNQYVLGYRPGNSAHDGKWRRITVKLAVPRGLPRLHVTARTGYYAPEPESR